MLVESERRNWMFDAGSWHWLSRGGTARCLMWVPVIEVQLDDCCGWLVSVEL